MLMWHTIIFNQLNVEWHIKEGKMFCYKCGKEVVNGAKFCISCGSEINHDKINIYGNSDKENKYDSLQEEYLGIIREKYINAYIINANPAMNILYINGQSYHMTRQMIDAEIEDLKKIIEQFNTYLKNLFANLLLLNVLEEADAEIYTYAKHIGLDENETDMLYSKFVRENNYNKKVEVLLEYLELYEEDGKFHDELSKNIPDLTDNELKKLKEAIICLEKLQEECHKESGSTELTELQMGQIYSKAMELGFRTPEDIDKCVNGYENKSGIIEKRVQEKIKQRTIEEMSMFDNIVGVKTFTLLNQQITFHAGYYVYNYIYNELIKKINSVGQRMPLYKLEASSPSIGTDIKMLTMNFYSNCANILADFSDELGISEEEQQMILELHTECAKEFGEDIDELKNVFRDIDEGIDSRKIQQELNKAMRGRWVFGGLGVKGAIKGAVAGELFNAGTGFAYSVANNIALKSYKRNAEKAKEELLGETKKFLQQYFSDMSLICANIIMYVIAERHPYGVWVEDVKEEEKIYQQYLDEKDITEKKKLSIRLLMSNPINYRNYAIIGIFICEAGKMDDIKVLMNIADDFVSAEQLNDLKQFVLSECYNFYKKDNFDKYLDIIWDLEKNMAFVSETFEHEIIKEYIRVQMGNSTEKAFQRIIAIVEKHDSVFLNRNWISWNQEVLDFYFEYKNNRINWNSVEDVNNLIEEVEHAKEYFDSEHEKYQIRSNILLTNNIIYDCNNKDYLIEYIRKLKEFPDYKMDFNDLLQKYEKKLQTILEQEDIESRSIYDLCICDGNIKKEKILLDTAEQAESVRKTINEIMNIYQQINFKQYSEELKSQIEEISHLSDECGYAKQLKIYVNERLKKSEEKAHKVKGRYYETIEEAEYVKNELAEFDQIKKNNNPEDVIKKVSQRNFKSECVNQEIEKYIQRNSIVEDVAYPSIEQAMAVKKELEVFQKMVSKRKSDINILRELYEKKFHSEQVWKKIKEYERDVILDYRQKKTENDKIKANGVKRIPILLIAIVVIIIGILALFFNIIVGLIVIAFGVHLWGIQSDLKEELNDMEKYNNINIVSGRVKFKDMESFQPNITIPIPANPIIVHQNNGEYAEKSLIKNTQKNKEKSMFCTRCGQRIDRTVKFCNYCGTVNNYGK